FNLYPHAQQNAKMRQIVASPDTKHYLLHDVYTHVRSVPLKEEEHVHDEHSDHSEDDHYEEPVPHEVSVGDTIRLRESKVVVKSINKNATIQNIPLNKEDVAIGMKLEVITDHGTYQAEPIFLIKGNTKLDFGKKVDEADLKLRFTNILPQKDKLELTIYQ